MSNELNSTDFRRTEKGNGFVTFKKTNKPHPNRWD